MDKGHRKVFGRKGLVSMVENYIEDEAHRHVVVVVDSHNEVYHSH